MTLVAGTINVTTVNVATQFTTTGFAVPRYATGSLPTGVEGDLVYDSTTKNLKIKTDSAWVVVGTQTGS
jgi:hypothetical protein